MRLLYVGIVMFACLPLAAQEPTAPAAVAQKPPNIPDKFTNLMVFPASDQEPQLVGVMKQMAVTMKVRCNYCHAVTDDLSEGDFASDEKPTKLEARKMLRLIHEATLDDKK